MVNSKFVNNDLPKEVLSEEKYKKTARKINKVGKCIVFIGGGIGLCLIIIGLVMKSNQHGVDLNRNADQSLIESSNEFRAAKEKLAEQQQIVADLESGAAVIKAESDLDAATAKRKELNAKVEAEKIEITQKYDDAWYGLDPFKQDDQIDEIRAKLKTIDDKYRFELQESAKNVRTAETALRSARDGVTSAIKERLQSAEQSVQSAISWAENKMKSENAKTLMIFVAIGAPLTMFSLMIGGILLLISRQREISAHMAQAAIPVAGERMVKMSAYTGEAMSNVVDSLDESGALDKIAKTGAKFMGRSTDEKNT
jgi:exonuclease VII small subunit